MSIYASLNVSTLNGVDEDLTIWTCSPCMIES